MYLSKRVLLVLVLVSCSSFASTLPKKIEVFYDHRSGSVVETEVAGVEVTYYQLDKSGGLEGEINKLLPTNLDEAAAFMSRYANSEEGKELIQAIVNGYQGVGRAHGLGVAKLPATVIDERYVVYGTTDVSVSLSIWTSISKGAEK